jgi:hypothetical protein
MRNAVLLGSLTVESDAVKVFIVPIIVLIGMEWTRDCRRVNSGAWQPSRAGWSSERV